jgi:hypothetical protein
MAPVIDFDPDNKVATNNYDFPKLKLKNGERARIVLLENPVVEYVHTLRKPQIINGIPQMVTATRKDGTEYQDYKRDFLTRALCMGDYATLTKDGADPEQCPMCAMAKEHPDWVPNPQRRYALNVVRYKTKGSTWDLITPFSIEILVWSFTDKVFNQIIDFKAEWGDLRGHDLNLGPCENETFQKFDIAVASKAAWAEDDARKALTVEAFKENRLEDVTLAIGTRKEPRWITEDLNQISQAWTMIGGADAAMERIGTPTSLTADIDSLLGADTSGTSAVEEPKKAEPAPKKAASSAEEPAAPATDFDDLLAGIE